MLIIGVSKVGGVERSMGKCKRGFVGGWLFCLLSACTSNAPVAPVVESSQVQPLAEQVAIQRRQQQVREMLANAQQALADDHLMVPEFNSAYSWYRQVLDVDYSSAEAHWGMQQITKRYLQLAEQAFQERRIDRAEQLLQRAEMIAANPRQTGAIRERYKDIVRDNEVLLPAKSLSARNDAIRQQLASVAQKARDEESRLLIVARNDAEGRWVYKQMRMAVEGYRLRGNIELGRVPRIVLLD